MIAKHGDYSKYASQLQDAVYDIQQYFDELELYRYLTEVRDSLTIKLADEIADVQQSGTQMRYINLDIFIGARVKDEAEYYAVFIARKGEQKSKYIEYSVKDHVLTAYYGYVLDEDALNIIKLDALTAQKPGEKLSIPEINGKSWITMKHIITEVKEAGDDYFGTPQQVVELYKKAEIQNLNQDEQIILRMDNIFHKLYYICHFDQNYNFEITESFLLELKKQIEDMEAKLMQITDLNKINTMDELGQIFQKIIERVRQAD